MEFSINANIQGYIDGAEECPEEEILETLETIINSTFAGINITLRRLEDAGPCTNSTAGSNTYWIVANESGPTFGTVYD